MNKQELNTILEVNNKSIQLLTENSAQFEEILEVSTQNNNEIKEAISEIKVLNANCEELIRNNVDIKKKLDDLNKTQTKILIFLSSGVVTLLGKILYDFYFKH